MSNWRQWWRQCNIDCTRVAASRRIEWIEDALAPLRGDVADEDLQRLVYGIGATLGIEAYVWLVDVARLSREDAAATLRSNAIRLLLAVLAERGSALS